MNIIEKGIEAIKNIVPEKKKDDEINIPCSQNEEVEAEKSIEPIESIGSTEPDSICDKGITEEEFDEAEGIVEDIVLGVTLCKNCNNLSTIISSKGNPFCCLACQSNSGE